MVEAGLKKGSVDFTEGFTVLNKGGEWSMVAVGGPLPFFSDVGFARFPTGFCPCTLLDRATALCGGGPPTHFAAIWHRSLRGSWRHNSECKLR